MARNLCGQGYPNSPCMMDKQWSKGYQPLFDKNNFGDDGYPSKDDGHNFNNYKSMFMFHNRWIVPFISYLSMKYNALINVKIHFSIKVIKCCYKDQDTVTVEVEQQDEIK